MAALSRVQLEPADGPFVCRHLETDSVILSVVFCAWPSLDVYLQKEVGVGDLDSRVTVTVLFELTIFCLKVPLLELTGLQLTLLLQLTK